MPLSLHNGETIDITDSNIHKYWVPQKLYKNCVFVMEETFNQGYEGYAILTKDNRWVFFWKDTIESHGEKDYKEGRFDNQPFIRISVDHSDGEMDQ